MKLTTDEFAAVAAYERQLQVAVRSKYLRNIGRSGLAVLVPIYERVSGSRQRVNDNCAACILGFLQRLGAIYFADKTELEQGAAHVDADADAETETADGPTRKRGRRARTDD